MRVVTPQELSDSGLNPFAVQLLAESYRRCPKPVPVAFLFRGTPIALGYDPHALLGYLQFAMHCFERGDTPTPEAMGRMREAIRQAEPPITGDQDALAAIGATDGHTYVPLAIFPRDGGTGL